MIIEGFIVKMLVALALGLVIGLDREIKNAPVGVRTFSLVTMGAAGYTMLTMHLGDVSAQRIDVAIDPSRLIQGLIGGIGFLGAGAIIGSAAGNRIRGIATGAAIWIAGAVGVACGLGLYWEAVTVTLLSATLLIVSEIFQAKYGNREDVIREPADNGDGDQG